MKKIIFLILMAIVAVSAVADEADCADKRGKVNNIIQALAQGGLTKWTEAAGDILEYTMRCCGKELPTAEEQQQCAELATDKLDAQLLAGKIGQSNADTVNNYLEKYCYYLYPSRHPPSEINNCGCEDCKALGKETGDIAVFMQMSSGTTVSGFGYDIARYAQDCASGNCPPANPNREKAIKAVINMLSQTTVASAKIGGKDLTPVQAARRLMEYFQCCCECKRAAGTTVGVTEEIPAPTCTELYGRAFGCALGLKDRGLPTSSFNWLKSTLEKCEVTHAPLSHYDRQAMNELINELSAQGGYQGGCGAMLNLYMEKCCKPAAVTTAPTPVAVQPAAQAPAPTTVPAPSTAQPQAPSQVPSGQAVPAPSAPRSAEDICSAMLRELEQRESTETDWYERDRLLALIQCIRNCCDSYGYRPSETLPPAQPPSGQQQAEEDIAEQFSLLPPDVVYPQDLTLDEIRRLEERGIFWNPGAMQWQQEQIQQLDIAPPQVITLKSEVPTAGRAFEMGETGGMSNIVWVGLALVAIIAFLVLFRRRR